MEELYIAEVDYEEAKTAADLMSIFQDLAFALKALDRLVQLIEDGSKDHILPKSLWTSALIAYARCFSSGKRFGLTKEIFSDLDGGTGVHQFYVDLRNKHIAHSVNPFEQVAVGLILSPPGSSERKVEGIVNLSQSHLHPSVEGIKNLMALVQIAMKHVEQLGKEYQAKALEIGNRLPIDDLYTNARARIVTPGPSQADAARP